MKGRASAIGAVGVLLFLVGCGSTITAGPTTGAPASQPNATPTATPSTLKGPVGTTFTDTDVSNNVMRVTLTKVIDPAPGTAYESPTIGDRFVAAKFTIVGVTGTFSDDANINASLIGSDSQTYSADFDSVMGCTNFKSGAYTVTPGQTTVGCVMFQVPTSVTVAEIQWGGFLSGAPAVWTV